MENISFVRNGKEFEPTKNELKIVLNDYAKKIGELETKLAEFEDFMEEHGFESLDELKSNIECLKEETEWGKFNYNELFKSREELYKENQALKDRWEKLEKWIYKQMKVKYFDKFQVFQDILLRMKELEE